VSPVYSCGEQLFMKGISQLFGMPSENCSEDPIQVENGNEERRLCLSYTQKFACCQLSFRLLKKMRERRQAQHCVEQFIVKSR